MAKLHYEKDWSKVKEKLKEKYPLLTERDFENDDDEKAFLNHLSEQTGESTAELREIIRDI